MKSFRNFLAAALIAFSGLALAQGSPGVQFVAPTGKEIVGGIIGVQPNGQPSGVDGFMTLAQFRNAVQLQVVPTGTTVTTTLANTTGMLVATGAITTWNVVLPASPFDSEDLSISAPGGTVTTLAVTAPGTATIVGTAVTTLATGGAAGIEYQYNATANVWYRVR